MSCHPIYSLTNVTKVEYDNFFMRAPKCIFIIQKLCTWQFLSVIPFGTINMDILWRIFYTPHLDYRDVHHGDFRADITDWKEILSSKDQRPSRPSDTDLLNLTGKVLWDTVSNLKSIQLAFKFVSAGVCVREPANR